MHLKNNSPLSSQTKMCSSELKYNSWLNGFTTYIACSTSLNNALSKNKREYPKYNEIFQEKVENKKPKDIDLQVQEEFNYWARK